MAQTVQSISNMLVEEAQSPYTMTSLSAVHSEEPKPEDTLNLLFSIADSLNDLCITLEKIHYKVKMANLELQIRLKAKEKQE